MIVVVIVVKIIVAIIVVVVIYVIIIDVIVVVVNVIIIWTTVLQTAKLNKTKKRTNLRLLSQGFEYKEKTVPPCNAGVLQFFFEEL